MSNWDDDFDEKSDHQYMLEGGIEELIIEAIKTKNEDCLKVFFRPDNQHIKEYAKEMIRTHISKSKDAMFRKKILSML